MRSLIRSAVVLGMLGVFFTASGTVHAATLSISPESQTMSAGGSSTFSLRVGSQSQSINAVSGKISFPANLITVTSINTTGSIVNFWVNEPSYSNALGSISFEGVITNPGFKGSNAKVFTVSFRAKAKGTATLSIKDAQVLANDGLGTNVLTGSSGASISITALSAALSITSSTHPSTTLWYTSSLVTITLGLPPGIQSLRAGFTEDVASELPEITPTKTVEKTLSDGIWYFRASAKVGDVFSPEVTSLIHIDSTPPTLTVSRNLNNEVTIYANDLLSGIAKVVAVENGVETEIPVGELYRGTASVFAVYDLALNRTEKRLTNSEVLVNITEYPEEVGRRESFKIVGTAPADSLVHMYISKVPSTSIFSRTIEYKGQVDDDADFEVHAARSGEGFQALISPLAPGDYDIIARTDNGEKSQMVRVHVGISLWRSITLFITTHYLAILLVIGGILFLGLLLFLIRYFRGKLALSSLNNQNDSRYITLLRKIDHGAVLSMEDHILLDKLRRYIVDREGHI